MNRHGQRHWLDSVLGKRIVTVRLGVLGAGIALLAIYAYLRDWASYDLVIPVLISLGAAPIGYAGIPQLWADSGRLGDEVAGQHVEH